MELKIRSQGDIEKALVGWHTGRQGGISRAEAFAMVKAIEIWESAYDITLSIDPETLVACVSFCKKASDIFDIDPEFNPNELIELAQDPNTTVFELSDGGMVVKTGYSQIPMVYFCSDIYAYQIFNN